MKDAVAGQDHTIVLTDQGQVYTFGFGRLAINFFMRLFINPVGPSGHGKDIPEIISRPYKVKAF